MDGGWNTEDGYQNPREEPGRKHALRHACATRRSSWGSEAAAAAIPDGVTALISGSRISAINLTN